MAIIHFINRPKSQTSDGLFFVLRYTMQDKKMFWVSLIPSAILLILELVRHILSATSAIL